MSDGGMCSTAPRSGLAAMAWKCASISPGIRVRPRRSMTSAVPERIGTSETSTIRLPSTSTSTSSRSSSPAPSKILPWRNRVLMPGPPGHRRSVPAERRKSRRGAERRLATPAGAMHQAALRHRATRGSFLRRDVTLRRRPSLRRRSTSRAPPSRNRLAAGSVTFRRCSLMSMVWWASHCCHAGFETLSNTRLPSSPGRGGKSRPSASLAKPDALYGPRHLRCLAASRCPRRLSRIAGEESIRRASLKSRSAMRRTSRLELPRSRPALPLSGRPPLRTARDPAQWRRRVLSTAMLVAPRNMPLPPGAAQVSSPEEPAMMVPKGLVIACRVDLAAGRVDEFLVSEVPVKVSVVRVEQARSAHLGQAQ